MFGIGFILIGIVLLLQAWGVFAGIPAGVVWGVAFIVAGLIVAFGHSRRRERRAQWIAKHRGIKSDQNQGSGSAQQ